ncbi:MAG: hypothetical protein ACE5J9_01085 [Methanosarcinales archaeon]
MYKNNLLKTNVKSRCISNSILVCGSCIPIEHPQILDQFKEYTVLYACLEEEHINKLSWKLCTIVNIHKRSEVDMRKRIYCYKCKCRLFKMDNWWYKCKSCDL